MGLSMIGFPAVYGGHSTLMSPTAFIRRPQRWISALSAGSREGRVVTAAPNFAYEYTAQRGLPAPGEEVDLSNVVMIIGSEPVSMDAIDDVHRRVRAIRVAAHRDQTVVRHRRGDLVRVDHRAHRPSRRSSTSTVNNWPTVGRCASLRTPQALSRRCHAVRWPAASGPSSSTPMRGTELADGRVGEIWLHGNNIARRYWERPEDSRHTFGATLRVAAGAGQPCRRLTGRSNVAADRGPRGVPGRRAVRHRPARGMVLVDGRHHYPQDIEATTADASPMVRRGYVAAFATDDSVVIIAERASGTRRADPAAGDRRDPRGRL